MRHNILKDKIRNKDVALGVDLDFPNPGLAEYLGGLGFDWILIDAEHSSMTTDDCENICRACDNWGMSHVVRVRKNDPREIMDWLQAGVLGITVPHVRNAK